jgi:HAD superfamily hydrolase (TIGR01457 family)
VTASAEREPSTRRDASHREPLQPERLIDPYDLIAFDLDGVLYRGDQPIEGASSVVDSIRSSQKRLIFLTNNSARTPERIAARLHEMGFAVRTEEVVTSALATATMLAAEGAAGSSAFVIGEEGVRTALGDAGIDVVGGEPDRTDLVVVGWDRSADFAKLRRACLLVERGARLIATNGDRSFPAEDGLWPGAGALLAVITTTTGAEPTVVGKPATPMFDAAHSIAAAERPLMVGDRLDTDIAGAARARWDSVLVLTGVSTPGDMPEAPALPTFVVPDACALLEPGIRASIRHAETADLPGLAAVLDRAGLDAAGARERLEGTVVAVADPIDPNGRGGEGEVLATATVARFESGTLLRSVAVEQAVRGRGLGLLTASAALRRADARRPAFLFTEQARGFFAILGFEPVPADALPPVVARVGEREGCAASAVAMRRTPRAPDI